jgi:hypothetical protein
MTVLQRIGLVISVLWLIALPISVMMDSNRRANEFYTWCRSVESKIASEMSSSGLAATAEQQQEKCRTAAKFMTPTVLAHTLIAGNADTFTLWSLMLGPIVALWLIAGIIVTMARWVLTALRR